MNKKIWIATAVIGLVVVGTACKSSPAPAPAPAPATTEAPAPDPGGGGGGDTGTSLAASEKEWSVAVSPESASSGEITIDVTNDGTMTHEFVIFKTDLAPDALPLNEDGSAVDEEGKGVTHIAEVEDVEVGMTKPLTVSLEPGNYVVICNLPGHYSQGMHGALTIS